MELFYDLLREACTCFLLSFLVVRLISLIVSSSDDSICGSIKDKGVKRSATIDHYYHLDGENCFGGQEKKQLEFDALKVVTDAETQSKRIKFVDQNVKFEGLFVRDIDIVSSEVNAIDNDYPERYIKDVDDQDKKKLVDEGKRIVGFEDKVGEELESGKTSIAAVDHIKEAIHHDIGVNLGSEGVVDDVREGEDSINVYKGEVSGREFNVDEGELSDDEEWEGIERSELEKNFARAMNLVGCKDKQELLAAKAGTDVMMQFYGLQKIVMEGPCHEAQPLAIKRSARAKWNAWQKLGSMTREDAMEQYISLLSDNIPEWLDEHSTSLMAEWKSRSSRTGLDSSLEVN